MSIRTAIQKLDADNAKALGFDTKAEAVAYGAEVDEILAKRVEANE